MAGYFLGKWVGGLVGQGETAALIGAALGVVAGFANLFRMVKRFDRTNGS